MAGFITAESLVKSALQYAINFLVFPGVGTVIGLAIAIMTYLMGPDPYAANFWVSWWKDENDNEYPGYTKYPDGVTTELKKVDEAVKNALKTYARSADDLGIQRVPYLITMSAEGEENSIKRIYCNLTPELIRDGDYATNLTRAVLDGLLFTFSVFPSVEAIRLETPNPATLSAEECKAVIVSMYEARANDVMDVISNTGENYTAALENFKSAAYAAADVALAGYIACEEQARSDFLNTTGADVPGLALEFGITSDGSGWQDFQALQQAGQLPGYTEEPITVTIVKSTGFDILTGQEAGADQIVITQGAVEPVYDPFWWQAGSN